MLKRIARWTVLGAVATVLLTASHDLRAQARGNAGGNRTRGARDPAQFQERRLARYREQLEVTNEDEVLSVRQEAIALLIGLLR